MRVVRVLLVDDRAPFLRALADFAQRRWVRSGLDVSHTAFVPDQTSSTDAEPRSSTDPEPRQKGQVMRSFQRGA